MNVCIVGLGRAGRFHLHSIQQIAGVQLKYVVDPGLEQTEVSDEYKLLSDIEVALQDDDLDAVIVSCPTGFHYEYIRRSLKAGKHVFAEKPLGKTVDEIKTCFQLAADQNLALYLGFQRRYDQNFQALKAELPALGQIRTIKTSSRDNPKPSLDYLRISGNIFHDMLIHDFDMLQFLLGTKMPRSVFAYGHAYDPEIAAMQDFDTVLVTLQYDDGLMVSIDTSRIAAYGYDQRLELFGENGMAIAENVRNTSVQIHNAQGLHQSPINYSFPTRYQAAYKLEMEAFFDGIRHRILNNVSLKECLLGHLIADAGYLSATENRVIDFPTEFGKYL